MGFDPCNHSLKIWKSIRTPTSKVEIIWKCGFHSFTLLHSQEHEMWLPRSLLAHTFTSHCLGCKPKAWVVTYSIFQKILQYPQNIFKNHVYNQCIFTIPLHKGGDNYFNLAFNNFASMNKTKFHATPSFYFFFIVFYCWGSIGMPTR
jgi:hypothetical protein